MWDLVYHTKEETQVKGAWKQLTEENTKLMFSAFEILLYFTRKRFFAQT
jgi:hypothetical protein